MFVIAIVIVETVIATVIEYTAFESILKVRNIAETYGRINFRFSWNSSYCHRSSFYRNPSVITCV